MDRVQWAVDLALGNDLMVVLDMHHYDEIYKDYSTEKPKLLGMWKQIAKQFEKYSDELIFEALNEPRDAIGETEWNELFNEAIVVIRESNPRRSLVVGTTNWGAISGLEALELPQDSKEKQWTTVSN